MMVPQPFPLVLEVCDYNAVAQASLETCWPEANSLRLSSWGILLDMQSPQGFLVKDFRGKCPIFAGKAPRGLSLKEWVAAHGGFRRSGILSKKDLGVCVGEMGLIEKVCESVCGDLALAQ